MTTTQARSRRDAVLRRVEKMKALDREIEKLTQRESLLRAQREKLEHESISMLEKSGLESVSDSRWTTSIREKDVPVMEDFDKFWEHVRKKNIPELMTRAVNSRTWRERGQNVPGVGSFTKKSLSITKRR